MSGQPDQQTGNETRVFFEYPTDAGWKRFADRYRPKIVDWCRRLGLAVEAREDVAQEVLLILFRSMQPGHAHWDPAIGRLHGWLYTVVRNACKDALKKHRPTMELREEDAVGPDVADEIARDEVQRIAAERTRDRVGETAWEVFRLLKIEGLRGAEVAERTGLGIGTIYNYRSKVAPVYQQEFARLAGPNSP